MEFPVVFLCGVNQGNLPLEAQGRMQSIEEERRLFYVGMTRAKDELILLSSDHPSSFLEEIPQELFKTGGAACQQGSSSGAAAKLILISRNTEERAVIIPGETSCLIRPHKDLLRENFSGRAEPCSEPPPP